MKICLDANHFGGVGGIPTYSRNLIKNLLEIDKENEYILFYNSFKEKHSFPDLSHPNLEIKRISFPKKILNYLWIKFNIPKIENIVGKINIFHSHHCFLPAKKNCKPILTVHDVGYLRHPEYYENKKINEYDYKFLLQNSIKRADFIICDSYFTKNELLNIFNIKEEKVQVIYLGVDKKEPHKVEKNDNNYLLYIVGTYQPRKNVNKLIDAFKILCSKFDFDYKLIIQVGAGNIPEEIIRKVKEYNLEEKIKLVGRLSESELISLISGAKIFIYPSLYEGFGLPVLEAMSQGVPVIASNIASIPEVVGDAGILVNPESIDEIENAIYNLIINDELRKELSLRGIKRAEMFSWRKTAEETLKVYKNVCEG